MTRLLVDDTELDVYTVEDLSVRITKRQFSLEDFGTAKGDYTLNLNLPKTRRNLAFFQFIGDPQNASNFYSQRKYTALIEQDGLVVLKGQLTVDAVEQDLIECTIIGANISWVDAVDGLTLRDIESFPRYPYTGVRSEDYDPWDDQVSPSVGLQNVWDTSEEDGQYVMQFALVSYGNFACDPDSTAPNPLNGGITLLPESGGLIDGSILYSPAGGYPLSQFYFRGGVYLKEVLKAIFADAGYKLQGSFLQDETKNNLVVPYTDEDNQEPAWNWGRLAECEVRMPPGLDGFFTTSAETTFFQTTEKYIKDPAFEGPVVGQVALYDITEIFICPWRFTERNYDYGYNFRDFDVEEFEEVGGIDFIAEYDTFSSQYFAPVDGIYTIEADWAVFMEQQAFPAPRAACLLKNINTANNSDGYFREIQYDPFAGQFFFAGVQDGVLDYEEFPFEFIDGKLYTGTLSAEVELKANESVSLCLAIGGVVDTQPFPPDPILPNDATYFNPVATSTLKVSNIRQPTPTQEPYPFLLNPANLLPDMEQLEFVKGVSKLFNLYASVDDEAGVVSLDYQQDYFATSAQQPDWSSKTNIDKARIEPVSDVRTYKLRYTYEEGEAILVNEDYKFDFDFNREYGVEVKEIEIPFAPSAERTYTVVPETSELLNIYATFTTVSLNTRDELAKKLGELGDGTQQTSVAYTPRIVRWDGMQDFANSDYFASSFNYVGAVGSEKYSVAFPYQLPLCSAVDFFDPGSVEFVWDEYYLQQVRQLQKSVKVIVDVMLTAADIASLNQRQSVVVQGIAYIVQEVKDYDPVKATPTEVTLIKK
jgi:hypothetical protein